MIALVLLESKIPRYADPAAQNHSRVNRQREWGAGPRPPSGLRAA